MIPPTSAAFLSLLRFTGTLALLAALLACLVEAMTMLGPGACGL